MLGIGRAVGENDGCGHGSRESDLDAAVRHRRCANLTGLIALEMGYAAEGKHRMR